MCSGWFVIKRYWKWLIRKPKNILLLDLCGMWILIVVEKFGDFNLVFEWKILKIRLTDIFWLVNVTWETFSYSCKWSKEGPLFFIVFNYLSWSFFRLRLLKFHPKKENASDLSRWLVLVPEKDMPFEFVIFFNFCLISFQIIMHLLFVFGEGGEYASFWLI